MTSIKPLIYVLMAFGFLTSCSKADKFEGTQGKTTVQGVFGEWAAEPNRLDILKVTDLNGKPIAQAQVLIGQGLDQPFISNFVTTDSNGQFKSPGGWDSSQVVTISAKGFVRASYFGQLPQGQTFQLRPAQTSDRFELKGKGTGFQVKNQDNKIDFALMIPIVKKQDLFAFDLGMFISPESDTITVVGQKLDLPSNLSLPRQTESYSFLPVTLEKPVYRMYFDALGKRKVFTARGQFPFKEVVAELQNKKSFLDVINYFSLKGGSIKEANIAGPTQNMDLPVDELNFNQVRSFRSPSYASDEFLLAVPLSIYQGDLMPTDIKNVPTNTNFNLTTAAGETPQLLVVVKKKSEQYAVGSGKLTAALVPFNSNVQPTLLPMIENPQVISAAELKMQVPTAPGGVFPAGTMSVLSKLETRTSGGQSYEVSTRIWEVYSKDWQSGFHLPQWPDETPVAGKKRWEVSMLGALSNKAVDLNPRILETMTHATHSASDFE